MTTIATITAKEEQELRALLNTLSPRTLRVLQVMLEDLQAHRKEKAPNALVRLYLDGTLWDNNAEVWQELRRVIAHPFFRPV